MKARLLLVLFFVSIMLSCKKKDDNNPNPITQQKCIPQQIEYIAELGTNGTTHWADSFIYDGSGQLTKVVHKYNPDGIYYNFTYNSGKIVKIDRYESSGLWYTDSVFWNATGYVERVKVYLSNGSLSRDINFTYSSQKLSKREINYYPSNDYFGQVYSYNGDGTLSQSQVFDKNNNLQSSYKYTYNTSALSNKLYNAGKKELMDIHWNIDDWEMSVYDMFNYSPKIATGIDFQEIGNPLESYIITVDTTSNGYVSILKSDGHDVVNLTYQCK